ncbi:MAG: leukotoxin LktA family filamentous adhesin, partial [Acidaminococcaceae bacterium]|nr:leukotoxin LktA family filamentous adhesin [Acidaminococcaceae bacterium]
MNKAYKIIWSHARNCYVVVAEIARNHGKNNVKSVFSRLAMRSCTAMTQLAGLAFGLTKEAGRRLPVATVELPRTAAQWIVPLMTVGILLQAAPGFASTIKDADNKSLTSNGKVHDIYTQQILSNERVNFGYNRFKEFKITQGDIANMYFHLQGQPEKKTDNLVNLVKSKIDIQGTVNAIKDNRIGGNLYFLSADGMAVGKTGVINAGRFVAMVPASSNFTGNVGTSGMWGSTTQMAYQFEHYI